jgi:hypothetical protein
MACRWRSYLSPAAFFTLDTAAANYRDALLGIVQVHNIKGTESTTGAANSVPVGTVLLGYVSLLVPQADILLKTN